tara:strand:+ start:1055 stop:3037 length:1983 start_codon:yes stop_codon:yes gene_type:complete
MAEESDKLNKNSQEFSQNISDASLSAKGLVDSLSSFGKGQLFQSLNSDIRQFAKLLDKSGDHLKNVKAGIVGSAEAQKKLTQFQKLNQQIQQKSQALEANAVKNMKGKNAEQRKSFVDQVRGLQDIGNKTEKTFQNVAKFAKKGESQYTKMADTMSKAFNKAGFRNAAAASKGVATGMRKAALASKAKAKGFAKIMRLFPKMLKMGLRLGGALSGPVGWLVIILSYMYDLVKLWLKVNTEVVVMSRSLGRSRAEARKLRNAFQAIARQSENWVNTYHEIMLSHADFNKALGQSIYMFQGQAGILDGMATLRNRFQLSNKVATEFGIRAAVGGKNIWNIVDGVGKGALEMNKMFGKTADLRTVLQAASEVSGELRAVYADYPEELGKAVQTSLALGKSMNQIWNSTKQVLDFESSIEKELEAELFLNKSINAERLRAARMTGDMNVIQEELVKQMGTYSEFTKMNTFEREALANFLGFEVNALEDMILKSTLLQDINKQTNREEYEKVKNMTIQQTLQEKFAKTMEKLKYIIIDIFDGIENWEPPWLLRALTGMEKGTPFGDLGMTDQGRFKKAEKWFAESQAGSAIGVQSAIPREMEDFTIRTHPRDSLVMAGGTRLDGNSMDTDRIVEAINQNRVISYDGWGAGATSDHLTHNPDRWAN